MIRLKRPKNFLKRGSAVSIYVLAQGKVLFLQYSNRIGTRKHLTSKWNLPSGKVEKGESIFQTAVRELEEETGLKKKEKDLEYVRKYYACGEIDRVIYEFILKLDNIPEVKLSSEHKSFKWISREEFNNLDVVRGREEIWLHMSKIWDRIGV